MRPCRNYLAEVSVSKTIGAFHTVSLKKGGTALCVYFNIWTTRCMQVTSTLHLHTSGMGVRLFFDFWSYMLNMLEVWWHVIVHTFVYSSHTHHAITQGDYHIHSCSRSYGFVHSHAHSPSRSSEHLDISMLEGVKEACHHWKVSNWMKQESLVNHTSGGNPASTCWRFAYKVYLHTNNLNHHFIVGLFLQMMVGKLKLSVISVLSITFFWSMHSNAHVLFWHI